jgi:alpha-glucosidase
MTNESPREFTLDLSFLDESKYTVEIIKDGINADRYAGDYRKDTRILSIDYRGIIRLAPGGGWAAILKPKL